MKNKLSCMLPAVILFVMTGCKKNDTPPKDAVVVFESPGDISSTVEAFKNTLGTLNVSPGAVSGRREINWDGVPENLLDKALPGDFFNQTGSNAVAANQRGLLYDSGTFMISNNGFESINSKAASAFSSFSGDKAFANIAAREWGITFQKAGTTNAASVNAFGAVFIDVDKKNSTSLEFFNNDKSIGRYFVPPHNDNSNFSFLGVRFNNGERITRIVVAHDGFLAEGSKDISDGGTQDLIILDDFIYSEPLAQQPVLPG
ncbi:MAG: hypothetical protein KF746_24515 [Chitinophagaceae bacterium]|nr:hypothetical protein [Chitinophagaceae bacterium]